MWQEIPGFSDYQASDDGRIRSRRCVLKPWLAAGYLTVGLRRDGRTHRIHVHRLVLMAFVGRPIDRLDGCHRDGDRFNNHIANLYWGTRSENILDQVRHGRHNNASKTHCKRGHEFTPDNTYDLKGGRRQCVACTKAQSKASHERRKAVAA